MEGRTLVFCIVVCLIRSGEADTASTGNIDSHHVLDLSIRSRVTCGFPGSPNYGTVNIRGGGHAIGVVARFSCAVGYKLRGPAISKCVPPGRWSNAVPTCQREQITCQKLTAPNNAMIEIGSSFNVVGSIVVYGCKPGYVLHGHRVRVCTAASQGTWSGSNPTCVEIMCPRLTAPNNARIEYRSSVNVVGSKVVYTCKAGYVLYGNRERVCTTAFGQQGTWSGSNPTCVAVHCGNPGRPQNGERVGTYFVFRSVVTFECSPGYRLRGNYRLECKENKRWSGKRPDCVACPLNEYKVGTNNLPTCTKCPANSRTITSASSYPRHCSCKSGFRGPPGGPCKQILCPRLDQAPYKGYVTKYGTNEVGARILYRCAPGYIMDRGDSERTCILLHTNEAKWSGNEPVCIACPKNTYKKSDKACLRCPRDSHTAGPGTALGGCVCDKGFTGSNGKPCTDIDECKTNNGGCDQVCINFKGSFRCKCNIPGYVLEPENPKKCKAEKRCGVPHRPPNGGLVCVADDKSNSVQCMVRCNKRYEFPIQTNAYETCGPVTNFKWTGPSSSLICIREFLPGMKLSPAHAYFPSRCSQLTSAQQIQVKATFIDILKKHNVCKNYNAHCNVGHTLILCGPATA